MQSLGHMRDTAQFTWSIRGVSNFELLRRIELHAFRVGSLTDQENVL